MRKGKEKEWLILSISQYVCLLYLMGGNGEMLESRDCSQIITRSYAFPSYPMTQKPNVFPHENALDRPFFGYVWSLIRRGRDRSNLCWKRSEVRTGPCSFCSWEKKRAQVLNWTIELQHMFRTTFLCVWYDLIHHVITRTSGAWGY